MKFVFSLFLLLTYWLPLAAQESASNDSTASQPRAAIEPVVTYQRSGGPDYKIHVTNDRTLVYDGIAYVKTKGKIATKITDVQFQKLISAFKDARFFSLRGAYDFKNGCTAGGSEGPWVILTLRTEKTVKSINHDLGCDWGSKKFVREMKTLLQLENRIHEILNIDQWIGTEEERNKLPNPLAKPKKDS